jgi:DNA-binding GntR family transcriptional regulator
MVGKRMKIQQTTLGDQVYSVLWDWIASRKLRPGDKISDLRLSEELGVSRTPVREALHRLTQDGIVRTESRRGFYIPTFSSQDVHEVYDIRCALEVLAVRLALPRLTREQLDQEMWNLAQARQKVEQADADARDYWLKVDRGFHQLLVDAAQNRRLVGLIAGLQAQIAVFQVFGTHFRPINLLSIDHHQVILAALVDHDGPAAEQAMERHIQEVKGWMLAELASQSADT